MLWHGAKLIILSNGYQRGTGIKREFQLERVVLFNDAVFAIPVLLVFVVIANACHAGPNVFTYGLVIWAFSIVIIRKKFIRARKIERPCRQII